MSLELNRANPARDKGSDRVKMTTWTPRVNYDLIAHIYDEPGRDYGVDPYLVDFLRRQAGLDRSLIRILDAGCGTGKQLAADHGEFPELQMAGLDLFHGMLRQARGRCSAINWIQGDSANLPIDGGSFDYITSQFSYHHVRDKGRMIAETHRVLKPGGRFVITNLDPWSMAGWVVYTYFPASRQRDLADFLPVEELASLMERTGFHNIRVSRKHSRKEEKLSELLGYASQRFRTSQLISIPDREYHAGLAMLKEDVTRLGVHSCISSEICLVWMTGDKRK